MTGIKLYGATEACSLAAHILLNELGVQYDPIVFRVQDGIPQELMKLNPKAKVPVLLIDDEVITENVAILTAIAQLAPEKHLLGRTDLEKLRVYEYLGYLSSTMHGQAYGGFFRPGRYTDNEALLPSIREKSKHTILACYEYIEAGLKGVHAVGNQLTVVDPYLYVFWRWGSVHTPGMQTRYPKFAALIEELGKLESVRRTVKEEGIEGSLLRIHRPNQRIFGLLISHRVPRTDHHRAGIGRKGDSIRQMMRISSVLESPTRTQIPRV